MMRSSRCFALLTLALCALASSPAAEAAPGANLRRALQCDFFSSDCHASASYIGGGGSKYSKEEDDYPNHASVMDDKDSDSFVTEVKVNAEDDKDASASAAFAGAAVAFATDEEQISGAISGGGARVDGKGSGTSAMGEADDKLSAKTETCPDVEEGNHPSCDSSSANTHSDATASWDSHDGGKSLGFTGFDGVSVGPEYVQGAGGMLSVAYATDRSIVDRGNAGSLTVGTASTSEFSDLHDGGALNAQAAAAAGEEFLIASGVALGAGYNFGELLP